MKEKEYWKYNSSEEDEKSYIVIRKIEGNIVHISVYNILINGKVFNIAHIPIDYEILQHSLKEIFKNATYEIDESFDEGYENWKKSQGGIWNKPLKEIIMYVKDTILNSK